MTQTQAAAHPLSRACALSVPTSLLPPFKSARERHLRSTRALCAHRRRQSEPHAARTRSFGLACTCCRLLRLRRRTAREPSQPLVPKGTRAASRGLCPGRRRGFAGWFRRLAARPRGCRRSKFRHQGGLSHHHGPARSSNCHPTKISPPAHSEAASHASERARFARPGAPRLGVPEGRGIRQAEEVGRGGFVSALLAQFLLRNTCERERQPRVRRQGSGGQETRLGETKRPTFIFVWMLRGRPAFEDGFGRECAWSHPCHQCRRSLSCAPALLS